MIIAIKKSACDVVSIAGKNPFTERRLCHVELLDNSQKSVIESQELSASEVQYELEASQEPRK